MHEWSVADGYLSADPPAKSLRVRSGNALNDHVSITKEMTGMPDKAIHHALISTQLSELLNTLEVHQKYFLDQAEHLAMEFGLDAAYWSSLAPDAKEARQLILETSEV